MAIFHTIDAPKVGNNTMARMARLITIRLDDLKVAPLSAFVDPHKHTYRIRIICILYKAKITNNV